MIPSTAKHQNQTDPYGDAAYDETEWEQDFEVEDDAEPGETEADEAFEAASGEGAEDAPALSDKQKRLLDWMDAHDDVILEKLEQANESFETLQAGLSEEKPQEQQAKLKEILSVLDEIESNFSIFKSKESNLVESGISKEDIAALLDGGNSVTLSKEVTGLEEKLHKEKETIAARLESENQAKEEAADEEKQRGVMAEASKDLSDYLWGKDGKRSYFAADVKEKRGGKYGLRELYRGPSGQAEKFFTVFLPAALKSDSDAGWSELNSFLGQVPMKEASTFAALVTAIIEDHKPELWDRLPVQTVRDLADMANQGNAKTIYSYGGNGNYLHLTMGYKANSSVWKNRGFGKMDFDVESKDTLEFLMDKAVEKETTLKKEEAAQAETEGEFPEESEADLEAETETEDAEPAYPEEDIPETQF